MEVYWTGDIATDPTTFGGMTVRALLRHNLELGYIPLDSVPTGRPIPPCVAKPARPRNRNHNLHRIWHWTIAGLKHPRLGFA